jgi:hypothetical protein
MNKNSLPAVALGGVAVLIAIAGVQLLPTLWCFAVFEWLSRAIARDAGMQPFLASAIAAIFSVFFVETLWHMFTGSPDTRRFARWLLFAELAVYFGLLAFTTREHNFSRGNEIAYIEVQPDGSIHRSYSVTNPYTNLPNIPITPENVRLLDGAPARRIAVDENTQFFDSFGNARLWYGRDRKGAVQFFDKPGRNPYTGEPLLNPTKEAIDEALNATSAKTDAQLLSDPANAPKLVVTYAGMPLLHDNGTPMYWFVMTANRFELYDHDGFDPVNRERLQPLTAEYAHQLDGWLRERAGADQRNLSDFEAYLRREGAQQSYPAHK